MEFFISEVFALLFALMGYITLRRVRKAFPDWEPRRWDLWGIYWLWWWLWIRAGVRDLECWVRKVQVA